MKEIDFSTLTTRWSIFPDRRFLSSAKLLKFRRLYGEAHATLRSSIFLRFQQITFKLSNFINLKALH